MKVYVIEKSPVMINGSLNLNPQYKSTKYTYEDPYKALDKLHRLYKDFPDYYYMIKEVLKE